MESGQEAERTRVTAIPDIIQNPFCSGRYANIVSARDQAQCKRVVHPYSHDMHIRT